MPKYSAIHHKVTLFGDCFGGAEIWSTGFSLGQTNGGDEGDAPTDQEAAAIGEAFKTFFTNTTSGISSAYRFTGCKVSHVNTLGKADAALTRYYNLTTPALGPSPSNPLPAQVSLVATLATLKQRGAGSKGRMYLPGVRHGLQADGKILTNEAAGVANTLKVFLDTVNASTVVPGVVTLMSAESAGVPFRAAEQNIVSSVRVGNVYDTQRRRRNQLKEQYSTAVLA